MASDPAASRNVAQLIEPRCAASTAILGRKADGAFCTPKPKKSLICVLKISTAIPDVKPTVTGYGMYLIIVPRRAIPIKNKMTPAIIVQIARFSGPYFALIPYRITMNAPVGPPMETRVPPRPEIIKPAITAVNIPACGGTPDAIANAMASGSATTPTVSPAIESARKASPE